MASSAAVLCAVCWRRRLWRLCGMRRLLWMAPLLWAVRWLLSGIPMWIADCMNQCRLADQLRSSGRGARFFCRTGRILSSAMTPAWKRSAREKQQHPSCRASRIWQICPQTVTSRESIVIACYQPLSEAYSASAVVSVFVWLSKASALASIYAAILFTSSCMSFKSAVGV